MRVLWAVSPRDGGDDAPALTPEFVVNVPEVDLEGLGENAQGAIIDDAVAEDFWAKCRLSWKKDT